LVDEDCLGTGFDAAAPALRADFFFFGNSALRLPLFPDLRFAMT
jgi:hypothetical protein